MNRLTWCIVGADSAIGASLAAHLRSQGEQVLGTSRRPQPAPGMLALDLARPQDWQLPEQADVAVLCAGISSLQACRENPDQTRTINVRNTLLLAERFQSIGTHVLFLSSSQVFDGSKPLAAPDDPRSPRTEYGAQKAEVELNVPRGTVVRLTKVLSPEYPLFAAWARDLAAGKTIRPFHDLPLAPLSMETAVAALAALGRERKSGIRHLSPQAEISYAEAASRLAQRLGRPELVEPVSALQASPPLEWIPRHAALEASATWSACGLPHPGPWEAVDLCLNRLVAQEAQ